MNGLAEALVCHASNVTGLVDKLEMRGLIERRSDESDRRVKMIALTRKGADVRARLVARLSEPPSFIQALSEGNKTKLLGILEDAAAQATKGR